MFFFETEALESTPPIEAVLDFSDSKREDLEEDWSSENIEEEQSDTSTGTQKTSQNLDWVEAEEFFPVIQAKQAVLKAVKVNQRVHLVVQQSLSVRWMTAFRHLKETVNQDW